ncbi:hypothetical protein NEF87_000666 [Candidatus Lokiarchaeum ossiferum]|uniref:Gelsolin-like domain-containing protein n=1 Tax=Candidatus Lokiarchaeum ossiferum TaxID=2951803 RepID=A0ABY6HLJ2_9ARCH|nr:hypothetical protein NEF87_000666 [Candidatus Lokiarchaeum sp. B-35]
MAIDEDYKDFRCYQLTDDGEREELDVELKDAEKLFNSEGVYLFVRFDLRRIFIWKGPKSPVRKRFISSRVGSKLQEESSQVGMHLKIVSVDAGDEPIEFLRAFNTNPYEIKEGEKLEDMYYIRNDERRKMEEEKLAKELEQKSGKKKEYWSPILEEEKRMKQMQEAKEKAASTAQEIATSLSSTPSKKKDFTPKVIKKAPTSRARDSFSPNKKKSGPNRSEEEEHAILDLILTHDCPENLERLNIIIGTSLFSPNKTISSVFGKTVEEIQWDRVGQIPDGNIDIDTHMLRAYCKNNQVEGLELFKTKTDTNQESTEETPVKDTTEKNKTKKKTSKKRTLKAIPKGN